MIPSRLIRSSPRRAFVAKADESGQFTRQRMDQLLAGASEQFKDEFLILVQQLGESMDLGAVAHALSVGNVGSALVLTEQLALGLTSAWAELYHEGGRQASSVVEDHVEIPVRFDVANHQAVAAVKGTELRLIREVSDAQRDLWREIIARGVGAGTNPLAVARELRDSLGLTQFQEQAVRNYRTLLEEGSRDALDRQLRDARFDPTVRRAISSDAPIPSQTIDLMVDRYRQKAINLRAETIARTEGLRAASEGVQAGFEQAVQRGVIEHSDVVREWAGRNDGRERESHILMNGQKRGLTEPFLSGDGNLLMYPRDPTAPAEDTINCRCRTLFRMK